MYYQKPLVVLHFICACCVSGLAIGQGDTTLINVPDLSGEKPRIVMRENRGQVATTSLTPALNVKFVF